MNHGTGPLCLRGHVVKKGNDSLEEKQRSRGGGCAQILRERSRKSYFMVLNEKLYFVRNHLYLLVPR